MCSKIVFKIHDLCKKLSFFMYVHCAATPAAHQSERIKQETRKISNFTALLHSGLTFETDEAGLARQPAFLSI